MSILQQALALLFMLPVTALAADARCHDFLGDTRNSLRVVRLFDGPVAEMAQLKPDNERGATWDVRGYKASDRTLLLLCEYSDRSHIEVPVDRSADRCYVKGKKKISAWCGK